MGRDMDLLREVLIAVRDLDRPYDDIKLPSREMDEHSPEVIFHLRLLAEKKLITLEEPSEFRFIKTLTDKGADVLECIEDSEGWEKLQDAIIYKGKPVTTDTVIQMVNHVLRVDFGDAPPHKRQSQTRHQRRRKNSPP